MNTNSLWATNLCLLAIALIVALLPAALPQISQAAAPAAPPARKELPGTYNWHSYLALVSNQPGLPMPVGQPDGWNLVFRDEFETGALDASRWNTCYPWSDPQTGCTNSGNNELQWYLPDGVSVSDGALRLTVLQRTVTGTNGQIYHYTSGMVSSGPSLGQPAKFAFQGGFVEARVKLPRGRGYWPGFWALPADLGWPPELDMLEAAGDQPALASMNVHWLDGLGTHQQNQTLFSGPDFTAGWHTFGLQWEATSLTWYIDGVARKTFSDPAGIPARPLYLLLNLAVDGSNPPDGTTAFPGVMQVDYVRAWQH